jgi:hypothetical protein
MWTTLALLALVGAFGLSLSLPVSTCRLPHPALEGGLFLAMPDFANDGISTKALRAIRLPPLASLDEERLAVALTEIERLRVELRLDCALNEIENMLRRCEEIERLLRRLAGR